MANTIITNFFKQTSAWDEKFDSFGPVEVNTKQIIILFVTLLVIVIGIFNGLLILAIIASIISLSFIIYTDQDVPIEKKLMKNIRFMIKHTSLNNSTLIRTSSVKKPKQVKKEKGGLTKIKHTIKKTQVPKMTFNIDNLEELIEISSVNSQQLYIKKYRSYS